MKFPRNARIFRGQLDAAPFAMVFFLLVIFVMLGSLVYTPGVHIQLPIAEGLPGTDKLTVAVAIDANGQLYYQNQWIEEKELRRRLRREVENSAEPLALLVQADKSVTYEKILRLALLASEVGITEAISATLPQVMAPNKELLP